MYKNQLQEFCQKHKLRLPIYNTIFVKDGFRSDVTIVYNNKKYITDGTSVTKKKAEMNAASAMLNIIDDIVNEHSNYYASDKQITVLVDMENVHMGNFFIHNKFGPMFKFVGFATENHPSIKVAPSELNEILTINSDRKDACDILMIGYAAREVDNILGDIIILTKDHFGPGLVDYLGMISKNNIINIKTIESLETYFQKYQKS